MTAIKPDHDSCSFVSAQANEPLFGSAPLTNFWIMLEHPHPPGAKALAESGLPENVRRHLATSLKSLPAGRFAFLRQTDLTRPPRLFLAVTLPDDNRLYEVPLEGIEQLLDLNLAQDFRDNDRFEAFRRSQPVYLVCTNGRRDPCCSRAGLPFFTALSALEPDNTFQSSHLGGHRFAPTVVCLPAGLYYGRAKPGEAPLLLAENRQNRLVLNRLRGKTWQAPSIQAAEYFLCQVTGERGVDTYRWKETRPAYAAGERNEWLIEFTRLTDGQVQWVRLAEEQSQASIYESCATPAERHNPRLYRLIAHGVV